MARLALPFALLLGLLPAAAPAAGPAAVACPVRAAVRDAPHLATAPGRWGAAQWTAAAAGVGAVAVAAGLDRDTAGQWPGHDRLAQVGNAWAVAAPAAAIAWYGGRGWLGRDPAALQVAANVTEAALLAVAATEVVKVAVGRERPAGDLENDRRLHPGNTAGRRNSFPSGHTALAFATAAALQEAPLPASTRAAAYGLAGLTAWSRLHDERHWLSDVVAGGLLGWATGRYVARRHPAAGRLTAVADGRRLLLAWQRRF
ncbi:MAG: phosphatase PAP2 family protein [Nitrospirae bacterium]|nr:MAG: phosphatase PAP2 family protein [Nitrospirota bacterium]